MTSERDDLIAAIGRLRQGIQSLNREGRERFLVAFEQVSGHFGSSSPSCSAAARPSSG